MTRLIAPPDGRQVFELPFTPEPVHIDANGHVNNVVYLAWAQDLAIAHWSSVAPAADQARWGWVVLRHEVDYRRPLKLGEPATGRTWVDDAPEGPRFARFCRFMADQRQHFALRGFHAAHAQAVSVQPPMLHSPLWKTAHRMAQQALRRRYG